MTSVGIPAQQTANQQTYLSRLIPDVRLSATIASGAAVVAAALLLTTIPYGRAIWDFLFLLDGAYRISVGQTPHLDFASPVGSLSLYLVFAAERLFPHGNPFVGLHALMWLVVLPIVAALAPRFRSGFAFAAALALLALMMLVPVTLDSTHLSEISYFASYNRFASGLLFLVGLWYVLPKSRYDGWLLAYALVLLFLLKITAAVVAVGIVVAACILGRASFRTLLAALFAGAVALTVINASTGLVASYLHDLRAMSATNQGRAVYALFFAAFRNWSVLAAAGGIFVVALIGFSRAAHPATRRPIETLSAILKQESFAIDACLLIAAALFAESQNTGGIGLIAAAAIFFHPQAWRNSTARAVASMLLLATLTLPVVDLMIKRGMTEVTRTREAATDQSINALFPGTRVARPTEEGARLFDRITREWLGFASEIQQAGFFVDPDPTSNASASRLAWAKSAVEAGQSFDTNGYRKFATRFATLSFADPFSRMLHLMPARGTTIAIEVGRTMPPLTADAAHRYLANADGVFVDRCTIGESVSTAAGFQIVLDQEFERLPLHRCWDFYRRTPSSQPGKAS